MDDDDEGRRGKGILWVSEVDGMSARENSMVECRFWCGQIEDPRFETAIINCGERKKNLRLDCSSRLKQMTNRD
ncbi:predicted protein [Sclerotinia sclerotiorum 1980 UF-70]|uniref:Uncharacterized protein n=1 Tax=Sclerotinia sclerotiorum (strain ATCC 18683 / 1980 / Ss-1) TaxID=665079 RepID=A7EGZ1_SCLS1|nr:predicted protein [Sclerotinia sclerotiorum 1980 UF-70]EDO02107.1 predicted protein [Sclerotinia sclerotiorum 1980 UF-70]